ncbi:MAG: AI-2E family transporter YdiK [Reyranella sp.]|uniref:AI-2E family transporter YdiK n=1 Tax=Reyranella sp. TaxID=1929291 RepID=UPI001AC90317|nr:AI-2E family transporter YdiK [Reyranella sp.]MBN9088264.1 AI-2E family transporter YdiK [Reyranella sp.]
MASESRDLTRTTLAVLFIGGLMVASFVVVRPFLPAVVWATTLVIATWPLMLRVQAALGGRRGLAVTAMTLVLALVVLVPLSVAIGAVVSHSDRIAAFVTAAPSLHVPPPPGWVSDIPLIGRPLAERWLRLAEAGVDDVLRLVRPYLGTATQWFVGLAGGVGGTLVHLLLTIVFAAILYARGEKAGAWLVRFGRRLAGDRGAEAVMLAGQATRSVALGVVVTAIAQTAVVGIGLAVTGVPQAALLSAIVLLLCVAQLGPVVVAVPAIVWLFWSGNTGLGIVLTVFTIVALTLDNFLRPILIKRGADLPLLLILAGVIGGLLAFGLLGLFLGPVILAVSYTLLQRWVAEAG